MPQDINITLGKNLELIGFDKLEAAEMDVINKLLLKYVPRIQDQVAFNVLRIRLKQTQKGKNFKHELDADLIITNREIINASLEYKNIYNGFNIIMKKLLAGIEHHVKKKNAPTSNKEINKRILIFRKWHKRKNKGTREEFHLASTFKNSKRETK